MSGDREARRRIATELDSTFVVEAAAGTGKTTALVGRILEVLRRGRGRLPGIAAVTFTEKAAGEMKLRLRAEIDRARLEAAPGSAEAARLEDALAELELAHIGTIHSFCADLLRQRPLEAGVDPRFEVIDEDAADELLFRAVSGWFERALQAPPPGLRRFLARRPWGRGGGPRRALLEAARSIALRRDHPTPWRADAFDRDAALDRLAGEIATLGALAARGPGSRDYLVRALSQLDRLARRTARREARAPREYDRLEADVAWLFRTMDWKRRGSSREYAEGLPRADVLERREALRQEIESFLVAADADLAAALFAELEPVVAGYEALKARRGELDFLDLLLRARDLVRRDAAVRDELQRRFSHIFVDELQDTDPLQAELVLLLCADDPGCADPFACRPVPGKLFAVGDPKQSIYRFRRADVGLYHQARAHLVAAGAEPLELSTSYRAVPAIQRAVNASFRAAMDASDPHHPHYVALERYRPPIDGQPAVIALPIPRPYDERGEINARAIERSTPDAVAGFVEWLLSESGWRVSSASSGELGPVESRHVCLLFRRLTSFGRDIARPYVRALEARGIPHVLVGGRSFHEREEIMALRAVLAAVEWPEDELEVYASLRGPFISIDDAALAAFRHQVGRLHPLRPLEERERLAHPEVAAALSLFGELHRRRNRRAASETVAAFLAATRSHAAVGMWPTGEQSLANVLRLLEQARRFEARGATSFRSFVDWLDDRAERGADPGAPIVEEGSEGVRLMTVHKAKGLEFPVVIACDPTCSRRRRFPSRFIDARRQLWAFPLAGFIPADVRAHQSEVLEGDEAEEVRISYVAATRARDLLVVPACGDGPQPGWLDVLDPALFPARKRVARAAPGCPPFGPDSVASRPPDAGAAAPDSVAPGWHDLDGGGHVVWWDPRALRLEAPPIGGIRQQDLLRVDEAGESDRLGIEAFVAWRSRRESLLAAGARPGPGSISATALSHRPGPPPPSSVTAGATAENGRPRPDGLRLGTLVHAVLADVSFAAGGEAIAALVALHAAVLGAPDDEVAAAERAVSAALGHPIIAAAAEAEAGDRCHRELPLQRAGGDATVVDGIADLVFWHRQEGLWLVVDYKTDPDYDQPPYRRQVATYAEIVAAARGEPARGYLLGV